MQGCPVVFLLQAEEHPGPALAEAGHRQSVVGFRFELFKALLHSWHGSPSHGASETIAQHQQSFFVMPGFLEHAEALFGQIPSFVVILHGSIQHCQVGLGIRVFYPEFHGNLQSIQEQRQSLCRMPFDKSIYTGLVHFIHPRLCRRRTPDLITVLQQGREMLE